MTFDEFLEYCSFDYADFDDNTTDVTVIFSSAVIKDYGTQFVSSNREIANKITAQVLYDYLNERFNNG